MRKIIILILISLLVFLSSCLPPNRWDDLYASPNPRLSEVMDIPSGEEPGVSAEPYEPVSIEPVPSFPTDNEPSVSLTEGQAQEGWPEAETLRGADLVEGQANGLPDDQTAPTEQPAGEPSPKTSVYGIQLGTPFYFYRNYLTEAETIVYDQLLQGLRNAEPVIYLSPLADRYRIFEVFQSVRFDHPDLFWVMPEMSYSYESSGFVLHVRPSYYAAADRLAESKALFERCADSVLEVAMTLPRDIDKVKFIHDLLLNTVDYSTSAEMNQSAYSAVVLGKTVCAGYAAAFQYYMQRLGIVAATLSGDAGEKHAWNLIQLGGEYYNIDVTWNDPIGNPPITYYYTYFNVTDEFISASHTRQGVCKDFPSASGTLYGYAAFFGTQPGSDFSAVDYGNPSAALIPLVAE